jgi:hypothetical protein
MIAMKTLVNINQSFIKLRRNSKLLSFNFFSDKDEEDSPVKNENLRESHDSGKIKFNKIYLKLAQKIKTKKELII